MDFERREISAAIELALLRSEHAVELFTVIERNRQHLRRWLPWLDSVKTVDDEAAFLRLCEEQLANNIAFNCGIFCDGAIVGGVGLHLIDHANRKVDFGYWVDEGQQ